MSWLKNLLLLNPSIFYLMITCKIYWFWFWIKEMSIAAPVHQSNQEGISHTWRTSVDSKVAANAPVIKELISFSENDLKSVLSPRKVYTLFHWYALFHLYYLDAQWYYAFFNQFSSYVCFVWFCVLSVVSFLWRATCLLQKNIYINI